MIETTATCYTPEEAVDSVLFVHSAKIRRSSVTWLILAALSLIVGIASFIGGVQGIWGIFFLAVAALYLILAALVPTLTKANARKFVSNPENKRYFTPTSATITESEIHIATEDGAESKLPWTNILKWKPWGENVMLFVSEYGYLTMFRRAFKPEDWEAFTCLVSRVQRS